MIIKIARYFKYPDLNRQTPNCSMQWKDFTFTEEDIDECDYLVILDYPKDDFSIKVNSKNVLNILIYHLIFKFKSTRKFRSLNPDPKADKELSETKVLL